MKIAVIGDVHYGASYSLGYSTEEVSNSRLLDYHASLTYVLNKSVEEGCEVIVFTGDIYEKRDPSPEQQKYFSAALSKILEHKQIKKIIIVTGNHDQKRGTDTLSTSNLAELKLSNLVVTNEIQRFDFIDPQANVELYCLPYRDKKYYNSKTAEEAVNVIKYKLNAIHAPTSNFKLLVGHMAFEGTFFSEDDAELYHDNDLFLSTELFKPYNLTLMGHVHNPWTISSKPPIFYVGSLEKRSHTENHNKTFAIVDAVSRKIDFHKIPCREIYSIKLDYSSELLSTKTNHRIITDSKNYSFDADSIIKVEIKIASEDIDHLDISAIKKEIEEHYAANNVIMSKPILVDRAAATYVEKISESLTDEQVLLAYIGFSTDISEKELDIRKKLGLEIIKNTGK